MTEAYAVKAVKNCRNYTRKCYSLATDINQQLINDLEDYGILEVIDFSTFSPLAKPCFKIKCFDELEISGVLHGRDLFIVIAKTANYRLFEELEEIVEQWFTNTIIHS